MGETAPQKRGEREIVLEGKGEAPPYTLLQGLGPSNTFSNTGTRASINQTIPRGRPASGKETTRRSEAWPSH